MAAKMKMTWNALWWIIPLVLLLIGVAYLLANWDKVKGYLNAGKAALKPPAPGTTTPPTPVSLTTDQNTGRPLNWNLILSNGSEGGEVEALQYMLNTKFNSGLVQDGKFGAKTQKALSNATGQDSITLNNFYNLYFNNTSMGSAESDYNKVFANQPVYNPWGGFTGSPSLFQ